MLIIDTRKIINFDYYDKTSFFETMNGIKWQVQDNKWIEFYPPFV